MLSRHLGRVVEHFFRLDARSVGLEHLSRQVGIDRHAAGKGQELRLQETTS